MTAGVLTAVTAVGRGPIGDLAADADLLVATNPADHSLSFIAADTASVIGGAVFDGEPFVVGMRENRAYVGVSSVGFDSLAAVDTGTGDVVASYPLAEVGASVTALTVHPDGKVVFVARSGRDGVDIAVVDTTADDIGSIPFAADATSTINALRVSLDGRRLYAAVSNAFDGELVVIDGDEAMPLDSVAIGNPVRDIAVSPRGIVVLAWHPGSGGVVHLIDAESPTIVSSFVVGGSPTQLVLGRDGDRAYLVDEDRVDVFDIATGELVDTIAVGARPSCVAVSPDGGRLYVAYYAGVVTRHPVPRGSIVTAAERV
ncbi:YncE family protein [Mycobacterium sp. B14F4]|uniref:YncE family protein n=1 Tax=Mycobacterium sp. B14F4 TaxID=3153565 RepID=UPI00325F915F